MSGTGPERRVMNTLIGFVFGLMIGAPLGMVLTALMTASSRRDDIGDDW